MKYFEKYTSNTCAGSGNQLFFSLPEGKVRVGRVFYKIFCGGEYDYSILFSNIMDSTYANGARSHKNLICDSWNIHSAKIGKCKSFNSEKEFSKMTLSDSGEADVTVSDLKEITFSGKHEKCVMPGEFFYSDPIRLSFEKNEYLCLEITFSGKMIPYHEESILPVFTNDGEGWKYCREMPFASMVGCDREVKTRIGYFGDSITQGIGVPYNSYLHWNAHLSEKIGEDFAFWNLGIGYGRASDAASDGAWLYKAKQNDVVFVCYGVNDIIQGEPEEQIKHDLRFIVEVLKNEGKTVILQTIPPFNYNEQKRVIWERLNEYIKTELKLKVDFLFDNTGILGEENAPHIAKFGGHPNAEGSEIWANAFFEELKKCK